MRFFVTGVCGQLGHDVVNELIKRGHLAVGSDIADSYLGVQDGSEVTKAPYVKLDITDEAAVKKLFAEGFSDGKIDVIVHCAAWTAVDAAEDEANKPKVKAINADGTKYLAEAAKNIDAKMIYISTDYVFNGQGDTPWQPDQKDYAPLNYYGETKLMGEQAVSSTLSKYFIVRIAWVFGLNGKNFIKTMLNVGKTHPEVRVVNDQIGTYHATNEGGFISWYDFTKEIYKQAGMDTKVTPVTTAEYGLSKAARPFNSRLSKDKLVENGFKPLPDWKDAVKRYLEIL